MDKNKITAIAGVCLFVIFVLFGAFGGDPEIIDNALDQTNRAIDTVERAADTVTATTDKLGIE